MKWLLLKWLTIAKNASNNEIVSSVFAPIKVSPQSQQIADSFSKHPEEISDGQILDKCSHGHAESITVSQGGSSSNHKHSVEDDQHSVRH